MTVDPSKPQTTALGCLFRIGVAIFALSIPIAVAIFVYALREHQKHADSLAAEVQWIRDHEEPLTSEDLDEFYRLPEGVPDITAVYLAALAPLENKELFARLNRLKPLCTLHRPGEEPPHRPAVWERLAEAETELLPFQEILAKVEAAAQETGGVRYPLDFSLGWNAPIPHGERCRAALPALELSAICFYQRGKLSRAADVILATIRLSESIRHEPLVASQLMRTSMLQVAIRLTAYLAVDPEFSVADLERLQAAFATVEFESIRLPLLLAERANAHIALSQPATLEQASHWALPVGTVVTKSRPGDCAMLMLWQREGIEIARLPLPQAMPASRLMGQRFALENERSRHLPRWMRNHVATREIPLAETLLRGLGRAESECRAAVAFCACERFRRTKNQNVDQLQTLKDLVPEFLAAVPADPFTGQPLSLICWTQQEYAVYGFGENGIDDNGDVRPEGVGLDAGIKSIRPVPPR